MSEVQASVIVPVYKAEKYLRRCLDSIAAQTYRDFEVILIDDGSPDHSGAICDEYAEKDPRFRVFHQKNQGIGEVRARGIKEAKGRYIFWVDSDDYVEPVLLDKVLKCFKQTDAEIVVYGSKEIRNGKLIRIKKWKQQSLESWKKAAINGEVNNVWSFAAKTELWKKDKIPEEMNRSGEDVYMLVNLFMEACKIESIPEILYYYCSDNIGSITHDFSGRRCQGNAYSWYYRFCASEKYFPEESQICAKKTLSGAVKAVCMNLIYQDLTENERIALIHLLKNLPGQYLANRWRDRFLRWAIIKGYWRICRFYAKHKIKNMG